MKNFEWWLLKINGKEFPLDWIRDYRSNGDIVFKTPPLFLKDIACIQQFFSPPEIVAVNYWDSKSRKYNSGQFRVSDIEYRVYKAYEKEKDILHLPMEIKLVRVQ